MTTSRPPRFAVALLNAFASDDALVGDLVEEFERRRSRVWLWRQTLTVVFLAVLRRRRPRPLRPLELVDRERVVERVELPIRVNLTASPIAGVGGLGLVA